MRKYLSSLALVTVLAAGAQANEVYLSWTDFAPNIDFAWAAGGYTGAGEELTASDYLFFTHSVKAKLETIYSGFSVTFHETLPGGVHEKLLFGASTGSSSLLGMAERIDWRNKFKDDVADIYAKNFGFVIDAGAHTRAVNLERLSTALAGTAAHELGHNLGLQHYDCYCHASRMAPGYGAPPSVQNMHIMGTGPTGITPDERATMRSLNLMETIKLEFADDFSPGLGTTVTEAAGDKDTLGSAQSVLGTLLSKSGVTAVNVDGTFSDDGEIDFYRIEAAVGDKLSMNTFSVGQPGTASNTHLVLTDFAGTPLITNSDISFSGDSFMSGLGPYSSDSLIWQYMAPYTGVYYVGVTGGTEGDYELLITGLSPVPEPGTLIALGMGGAYLLARRRRKKA